MLTLLGTVLAALKTIRIRQAVCGLIQAAGKKRCTNRSSTIARMLCFMQHRVRREFSFDQQ